MIFQGYIIPFNSPLDPPSPKQHYDDGSGDWDGYLRFDRLSRWIFICPNEEAKKRGTKKWEEEITPVFYDMLSLRQEPDYELQARKRRIVGGETTEAESLPAHLKKKKKVREGRIRI